MSINVTVTGNPVCIKRGKMVTADPKDVHKEFQKRRKIRLEQVRQQSKEIAESVRNKVRKEKSKQLSNVEKQCATKFNEWQNNKLLELQTQYRESLKDIGLGHTQARIEEAVETDFIEKRDKHNEATAFSRGLLAQQQEQIIRNEENLKKAIPVQTRKLARDVENARSAMVCKLKENSPMKKKKRKKSLVNVSITKDVSDSDSDVNLAEDNEESSESSSMTEFQDILVERSKRILEKEVSPKKKKKPTQETVGLHNKEAPSKSKNFFDECDNLRSESPKGSPSKRNHKSSLVTVTTTEASVYDHPFDTRISDRIKNRRLIDSRVLSNHPSRITEISETSSEDVGIRPHTHIHKETIDVDIHKPAETEYFENCGTQTKLDCKKKCNSGNCSTQINLNSKEKNNFEQDFCTPTNLNCKEKSNKCQCLKENNCTCVKKSKTQQTQTSLDKQKSCDLPSMPTVSVSLRSGVSQNNQNKRDYTRVQYYDHDNRFNKDYIIDGADVQKISQDSIEVCFNDDSEPEFQKQGGFQREKAAQIRGKKAMEKQKIQRDYEVLLKKLPVLQKQERIAGLDPDRDKFHMSENRLKDFEKNRQGRIEEAFEKLVPNTITIQPKQQREREKSPVLRTVDLQQTNKSRPKSPVVDSLQRNKSRTKSPGFKTVDLEKENNLAWKSVTNLLNRNNSKTSQENLRSLLNKLKAQKEILIQENNALPENSNLCNLLADLEKCNKKSSSTVTTASSSSSQSRVRQSFKKGGTPKKRRHNLHRDVLVLQNTSTQTSPKIEKVCDEKNAMSRGKHDGKRKCSSPEIEDDKISEKHCEKCLCKETFEVDVKKHEGKCLCPENDDDKICEIFIKIQDNEEPEIVINSPKDKKGAVSIDIKNVDKDNAENLEKRKSCLSKKTENSVQKRSCLSKKDDPARRKEKNENGSFWREQLSKNDATNSSTSYYSPPDYSKDSTNENIGSMLSKKPQQSNVTIESKAQKLDPDLLAYVKRLLEMSKGSIENLCVSSVSEVSTPSSSVIENQNNINPAQKLINLLKHLNINVDKRTKNLNMISKQNQTDGKDSNSFQSTCRENVVAHRERASREHVVMIHSPRRENEGMLLDPTENLLVKNITEITDKCQEKINKLTEKIQSLRAEKSIISPGSKSSGSDKENLTDYLNLPSVIILDANSKRSNGVEPAKNNSSRSNSPEQVALTNSLLQVDLTKTDTFDKATDLIKTITASVRRGEFDEMDGDIIERYVKLIALPPSEDDLVPFVPVLMDIPKLPKLTTSNVQNHERKPPPSKGLRCNNLDMVPHELSTIPEGDSIRRSKSPESPRSKNQEDLIQELLRNSRNNKCSENQDLNALKQIPKIQSPKKTVQLSERETASKNACGFREISPPVSKLISPSDSKKSSPQKIASPRTYSISPPSCENQNTYEVKGKSNDESQKSCFERRKSCNEKQKSLNCSDLYKNPKPGPSSEPQTQKATSEELIRIMQRLKDISTDSSTDKSEEFESILKNLGMNWAVSTLKKTQAAMARNSSSNSSSSSKLTSSTSNDINQSVSGSNSSMKNNNYLPDNFPDISAIHGSVLSVEKLQRTSTPVQTTKSSEKLRRERIFTGESDLSSVKETSKTEWKFISIPNCTTDDSTMN